MFEETLFFFRNYGLLAIGILTAVKVLYLFFEGRLSLTFLPYLFFKVYSGHELYDHEASSKKMYRVISNVLTYTFYILLILWALFSLFLKNVPGEDLPPM
jgi:hypothetical protein